MEEEDVGKARGHGRPSSDKVKSGGRRPGDELPASEQPREKIFRKHSSHESTPEDRGSRSSRSSSNSAEAGPSREQPGPSREPGTSKERERPPPPAVEIPKREPAPQGRGDTRDPRDIQEARRLRYEIVQTRPKAVQSKRGQTGREVTLLANYFRLMTKPTWRIYQYHVDFSPDIEAPRMRRGALNQHKSILGGHIFDGTKVFTTTKLREDKVELESKSPTTGEICKITVKHVGLITMSEWQSLQVLNLILRRAMEGLKLQLVGRNFFDPKAKVDIREFRLQLWPGYTTSIRQHEQDILLCAEIAHKVMRTETLLDILNKCINDNRHDYQDTFRRMVLGTTVLTDYNNKTYRIDDVDYSSDCKKTFKYKGEMTTFIDYYKKKYDIRIRDQSQPLLVSVAKERQVRAGQNELCVLIPELCRATGINDTMRNNFQLMKAMAEHTRMNPPKRIERLRAFNRRLATTERSTEVLTEWNMSLDPNLVQFRGRVLKPENIVFARGKKVSAGDQADWTRHFRDSAMFTVAELKRWAVVLPNKCQREARDFIECLIQAAKGMNMIIRHPQMIPLYDDRNHSYMGGIDNCIKMDPQLIMCIVPNNNAERYGSIKKKACVERAIPTQVMCQKTVTPKKGNPRSLMSVATKVAIQMNCKLGSAAWMIELPLSGLMTIGYDLCRSTKDRKKAFGALVATMDMKSNAKYFSTVAPCHAFDQLSNEMSVSITKALQEYRSQHGTLPNRILLFRDGVGDGQIGQVVQHEVNTLVDRLKSIYKSAKIESGPRFAFVIVSKQVNTRIFTDRGQNPEPGTIADDIITLPERYDFYLVSQSVRQGTVSPTSYNVVYDSMGLDPDRMQILSYKMTHLYYNWSGTTRVPAVCQYAKKLATLVAQNIHQPPSNALEKQLYFL